MAEERRNTKEASVKEKEKKDASPQSTPQYLWSIFITCPFDDYSAPELVVRRRLFIADAFWIPKFIIVLWIGLFRVVDDIWSEFARLFCATSLDCATFDGIRCPQYVRSLPAHLRHAEPHERGFGARLRRHGQHIWTLVVPDQANDWSPVLASDSFSSCIVLRVHQHEPLFTCCRFMALRSCPLRNCAILCVGCSSSRFQGHL